MGSKIFDRFAGSGLLVVGASFILGSLQISKSAYGSKVGPNIFPMGLGLILILLSIRLLYETLRYQNKEESKKKLDLKKLGLILVILIGYVLIFEFLGYVISTFLFLVLTFQVMEKSKLLNSILISLVFSISIYYLYVGVLMGNLPAFPEWLNL